MSKLAIQGLGAIAWGVFLSASPVAYVLIYGSIIWIPIYIWREYVRAKKYGFWAGFGVRVAIIASIIWIAYIFPNKYEDRTAYGPFATKEMTLKNLAKAVDKINIRSPEKEDTLVALSSMRPTLRDVIRSIEGNPNLKCMVARCGTDASIFSGSYPIVIIVE